MILTVSTTLATRDDARRIAATLVSEKLAACAHVSPVESFYVWEDHLQDETEYRLDLKTPENLYPALEKRLLALHPYSLPAIHAQHLAAVHAPYAAWVMAGTKAPPDQRQDAMKG